MKRSTSVAIALATLLVGAFVVSTAWFRLSSKHSGNHAQVVTSAATASVTKESKRSASPSHVESTRRTIAIESRPGLHGTAAIGSVLAIERMAQSSTELLDGLDRLRGIEQQAAAHARKRLLDRCLPFVGDPRSRAVVTGAPGTALAIEQTRLIEREQRYCNDARLADTRSLIENWRARTRELAQSGDELSIAQALGMNRLGITREEEVEVARTIALTSGDPYAVRFALDALGSGELGQNSFDFGVPTSHASHDFANEVAVIREAAATWLSCDLGALCGPYSELQRSACFYRNNCAPGLTTKEFIRTRLLNDPQFELMEQYVQAILAARREAGAG